MNGYLLNISNIDTPHLFGYNKIYILTNTNDKEFIILWGATLSYLL